MTHPYRVICDYSDTHERRYLSEWHPDRPSADRAAQQHRRTQQWTSVTVRPSPIAASITGKQVLAVGGRLPQQSV